MGSQSQRAIITFTIIFIYFYGTLCFALNGINGVLLGGIFVLVGLILGNLFRVFTDNTQSASTKQRSKENQPCVE